MTAPTPPPGAAPAWMLRGGHPDLCPGSDTPAFHCYPVAPPAVCGVCGARVRTYSAPSATGGGRLTAHYRTDRQLTLDDYAEEAAGA